MIDQTTRQRLRLTFGKLGSQKYVGHLDLAKTWERILRRGQIPLSYTQGFNPRPRLQIATALSLGVTSDCEILDLWLDRPVELVGLAEHLMSKSPPGLPIHQIVEVPLNSPALQTVLESAVYLITPTPTNDTTDELIDPDELGRRAAELMAQPQLLRTRNEKTYDLRPLIISLAVNEAGQLRAELSLGAQGTARPDELVDALGLSGRLLSVHRVAIKLRE